jgi:hypothetical protein
MMRFAPERAFRPEFKNFCKREGCLLPKNRKIRAIAHFNTLKTYKSAKNFFLFLVRLSGGLRLLCERNLLL